MSTNRYNCYKCGKEFWTFTCEEEDEGTFERETNKPICFDCVKKDNRELQHEFNINDPIDD